MLPQRLVPATLASPMAAPEIVASRWFNTEQPLSLAGLRGRPVLIHAFQMLCPGCVAHGTPQAERAHRLFRDTDLQVIGLHTVFEHHEAMTPTALEAFIHEYRLTMPIAFDLPGTESLTPVTMSQYGLRGTPSSVMIGRDGRILHLGFGQENDMALGALIATALGSGNAVADTSGRETAAACEPDGCALPV